jgi:integrase
MNQPIVLTNGQHEVKIYTVQNRGREVFQLSYYEGGKRERQTFAKVSDARKEGKLALGRLAMNQHDVAELSTADMESYVVARKHVEPTGLPLHVCAELFVQAHAKLAGRSLADAVDFFVSFHPAETEVKPLVDLINDFAEGRRRMGVATDYVQNIKRQLGRLAKASEGKTLSQLRTVDLDAWLGALKWQPVTKNDVRKMCITFGNWAKSHRYLPSDRPTAFDGMMIYKVPSSRVTIYTPEQLRAMLSAVNRVRPELLPWLACAAFLGARVSELQKLRWECINFERGFVEVASNKVRTKARRLVPLHDALRAWLLPHRKESGLICAYAASQAALGYLKNETGVTPVDNGFRHSYISYRVAQINDTARVALEAGNSPEVIFQHYRELVGPDDAAAWFGVLPEGGTAPTPAPTPTSLPADEAAPVPAEALAA